MIASEPPSLYWTISFWPSRRICRTSSLPSWICAATTSGLALGTFDRLADVEGVAAAGVGPGRLLAAVHLPQLRARVVAVLRGDAVAVGTEHHAVTRRVELEEVVGELLQRRVLDGVGAPLLAGRQG